MDEDKFKFVIQAPIDKNGMTIRLAINEGLHTLYIKHYPEFTFHLLGLFVLLVASLFILLVNSYLLIYSALFLAYLLYEISNERALHCEINKNTGVIDYHRSGVLMTSLDEQRSEYVVSSVKRLEMQRHVRGGRHAFSNADTFQIYLSLGAGERIPLSPANLDFAECQEFSDQIREFIGGEITIKAID